MINKGIVQSFKNNAVSVIALRPDDEVEVVSICPAAKGKFKDLWWVFEVVEDG